MSASKFNEDSRVKIPSILHLCRLGYTYLSLKNCTWNIQTNIFEDIFLKSIERINPGLKEGEAQRILDEISLLLDNEDIGKAFYERLVQKTGHKIIDFDNFNNNTFNVVTELTYKNGEDEFRPDIILLINGMPLAFIEVKKPNNREGIIAEHNRIKTRFENKKFRRFVNITQLMVFSNNMKYDDRDSEPVQGAYYASPSYKKPIFNYFREDETFNLSKLLKAEDEEIENKILRDNNLVVIKHNAEFKTNKSPHTPTNEISTSLFSRERFKFILEYAIAYVAESKGLEKHIMRYPQIFATKEIENYLNSNKKSGIIWHTQGSGKTALTYFNVKFLTDYFQKKNIIPKFYFIVDRLDLLTQAKREFTARGLTVHTVNSKDEFMAELKRKSVIHNDRGNTEITVVNIHKFKDDPTVTKKSDYDLRVQRIYFLDEVHRSYNPKGSFLANLQQSDTEAIKIGLTGTPLLGKDYNSKSLFGNYIHKYYYNASIADGYTLRLIREEIASNYQIVLEKALKQIEVMKGNIPKKDVFAHPSFVEPMLDYMIEDFENFRKMNNDPSVGAMVVCDSSEQAKMLFEIFNNKYCSEPQAKVNEAAEGKSSYYTGFLNDTKVKTAALILHDVGSKDERKEWVEDFKDGKIDFLFVYNMLLTGFDAKRLKKLYIGRIIKKHNLLQTLTRVNRPHKKYRYGYVVDFADISEEFKRTNEDYFKELQDELGDEFEHYDQLFKSKEEIEEEIADIKEILFHFDTNNLEIFSQQISKIKDRAQMLKIVKSLGDAKSLYNLIRLSGQYDILDKVDFDKFNTLFKEANNHLQLLNTKEGIKNNLETTNLINVALEDVLFMFNKVGEEELLIADQLKNILRKTRENFIANFDKKDPEYVNLYEELERLFKKKNLDKVSQKEMQENIKNLREINAKIIELNRQNDLLKAKYSNDPKYCRIHKKLKTIGLTKRESQLFEALKAVKDDADTKIIHNSHLLDNDGYMDRMMIQLVMNHFVKENKIKLNPETTKFINRIVVQEYINEYHGRPA